MSGRLSFIEIGTPNPSVASGFLAKLFDWKFTPLGENGGGWFQTPTMRAGMHKATEAPSVDVYFEVEDIVAAIARVKQLGGEVEEPVLDEPDFGQFCHCRTPDGLRFGLHRLPVRVP